MYIFFSIKILSIIEIIFSVSFVRLYLSKIEFVSNSALSRYATSFLIKLFLSKLFNSKIYSSRFKIFTFFILFLNNIFSKNLLEIFFGIIITCLLLILF